MATTWASVELKLRALIVEVGGADYFLVDRLKEWYQEGAVHFHAQVIEAARGRPDINPRVHPFLAQFWTETSATNLASGTQEYALPVGCFEVLAFRLAPTGKPIVPGKFRSFAEDWRIRNIPSCRPAAWEVFWTVSDAKKLRVYFGTEDTVPNGAVPYVLSHYKTVDAVATNVGIEDPYNAGPIRWAVGQAVSSQETDLSPYVAQAVGAAENAVKPTPEKRTA